MNWDEWERMDADLISNHVVCPTCKMTATNVEQNPCLHCDCEWFANQKGYDEENEEEL